MLIVTLLVVLVGGGAAIARLASSQSSVTFSAAPSGSSATATAVAAKAAGIVYQNSFASDATGWGDDQYCFLGAGGYHVTTRTCFAPTGNLTNIDVTVQVKQISGQTISPYGLAIRIGGPAHALNQAYAFAIDSDRKWAFYRCDGILDSNGVPHCTKLVDFTPNDAIRSGLNVANVLEVKAQGSHFDFYVNGVRVGGASDSTYVSGMVGLAAEADAQSVFTNLTVKALR